MPKPFNLLLKCCDSRLDGSSCLAPAVKNSVFCRHHIKKHAEQLENARKNKGKHYSFLDGNSSEDGILSFYSLVPILKHNIRHFLEMPEIETPKGIAARIRLVTEIRKLISVIIKLEGKIKKQCEKCMRKLTEVIERTVLDPEDKRRLSDELSRLAKNEE